MSSNTAAPKLPDIPRKIPTQKCYLNTIEDKETYNFIKTTPPPTPIPPRKHSKTKDQLLSRTTSTDRLILVPSLVSLPLLTLSQ